jgi:hypothetical protein
MKKPKVRGAAMLLLAFLVAASLLLSGCAEKHTRVVPWATAIQVRPHVPASAPGDHPPLIEESAPDLPWAFEASAANLVVTRQPARPRVAAAQPAPEPPGTGTATETQAPLLVPQLSQQETAAAQQQMNDSIAAAQRNLVSAKNHRLNSLQTDLASKVNSFLEESRIAAKEGDWTRAKNLAKKAQVLSEELAQSL